MNPDNKSMAVLNLYNIKSHVSVCHRLSQGITLSTPESLLLVCYKYYLKGDKSFCASLLFDKSLCLIHNLQTVECGNGALSNISIYWKSANNDVNVILYAIISTCQFLTANSYLKNRCILEFVYYQSITSHCRIINGNRKYKQ